MALIDHVEALNDQEGGGHEAETRSKKIRVKAIGGRNRHAAIWVKGIYLTLFALCANAKCPSECDDPTNDSPAQCDVHKRDHWRL